MVDPTPNKETAVRAKKQRCSLAFRKTTEFKASFNFVSFLQQLLAMTFGLPVIVLTATTCDATVSTTRMT
jgi:hypothetical protein